MTAPDPVREGLDRRGPVDPPPPTVAIEANAATEAADGTPPTDDTEDAVTGEALQASLYLLRTTQQHHVQLSIMGDVKASIIVTISSVVLTVSLTRMPESDLRPTMVALAVTSCVSLLFALSAAIPSIRLRRAGGGDRRRNLLFFRDFVEVDRDEYVEQMLGVLSSSDSVLRTQLAGLHDLGSALAAGKYRWLRLAYLTYFLGAVVSAAVWLATYAL